MNKELVVEKISVPLIEQKRVETDEEYLNRLQMFLLVQESARGIDTDLSFKKEATHV